MANTTPNTPTTPVTKTTAPAGKTSTQSATEAARQAASNAASTAADTARDAAAKASGKLENAAETATQSAARLADDAIDTSLQRLDAVSEESKGQLEDVVRSLGRAVDAASSSLSDDGYAGTAGYVRAAANGLTQAADEVGGFDTHMLTDRVEGFVRHRPFLIAGGLAVAGFIFASSVKSNRR